MPNPPLLKVRAREALLTQEREHPIIEILDKDDNVVGQLPATRVRYEMLPHEIGTLHITVLVEHAEISGHA